MIRLLFFCDTFFALNLRKLKVEACPIVGRTYFISAGKIVAVASL